MRLFIYLFVYKISFTPDLSRIQIEGKLGDFPSNTQGNEGKYSLLSLHYKHSVNVLIESRTTRKCRHLTLLKMGAIYLIILLVY